MYMNLGIRLVTGSSAAALRYLVLDCPPCQHCPARVLQNVDFAPLVKFVQMGHRGTLLASIHRQLELASAAHIVKDDKDPTLHEMIRAKEEATKEADVPLGMCLQPPAGSPARRKRQRRRQTFLLEFACHPLHALPPDTGRASPPAPVPPGLQPCLCEPH